MENELDYDFIGRIGASHYGSDGMLFKFDRSGNLLVWLCDTGSWVDYPESHEVMLCDNVKPIPTKLTIHSKPMEVTESFADFCERLFWEYDNELKSTDSSRMLFKEYLSKAANFKEEQTQPKPEHKHIKKKFSKASEAVAAFERGEKLFCKLDGDSEFTSLYSAVAVCEQINGLYIEREVKQDWKAALSSYLDDCKEIDFDNVFDCILSSLGNDGDLAFDNEYVESCRVVLRELGEIKP